MSLIFCSTFLRTNFILQKQISKALFRLFVQETDKNGRMCNNSYPAYVIVIKYFSFYSTNYNFNKFNIFFVQFYILKRHTIKVEHCYILQ